MAHELNNPLTNVLGYAGIISESLSELKLPEELREDLDQIALNAKRCASIVTNLLLFVRKARAEKQSVCLTRVVRQSLHLLDYSFKKRDLVEVRVDMEKDLPPVWGSFSQLQQVLVNVLQNAAGAMSCPETPKQVALRARRAGEDVILEISDNGPGVPAALREKIFEPFFTTKADGTGLGLAICRQILSDHGGSIRCGESPLGGASFQFRLPRSRKSSPPDDGARAWPACPGKSVLIVDDEPGVLDLMRKILLEDGQKVETARSGREALAKLEKRRYDLVIADLHMEGVTGRSIRDGLLRDSSPTRFLLITGDVLGLGSGAEGEADASEVLVKPFSTSALRQCVRRLLRHASPP